jgi:hypothetical protein
MKCEFIAKDGWIVLDDELGKESGDGSGKPGSVGYGK